MFFNYKRKNNKHFTYKQKKLIFMKFYVFNALKQCAYEKITKSYETDEITIEMLNAFVNFAKTNNLISYKKDFGNDTITVYHKKDMQKNEYAIIIENYVTNIN